MSRRTLTFEPKTQHARRHRDTAVAWYVTQQEGRLIEAPNVTAAIHRGLRAAGFKVDQALIKRSMDNLVNGGYAQAEVIGKRTTLFLLDNDVDVPEPAFVVAKRQRNAAVSAAVDVALGPPVVEGRQVPLPNRGPQVPAVFAELGQAIIDWWREEPGPAEVWAEAALKAITT